MERQQIEEIPEEFEYIYYREGKKYSKPLKDMEDEELFRIYKSKSSISGRYEKDIKAISKQIEEANSSKAKLDKEIKSLNKKKEYISRKNSILLNVLDKVIQISEKREVTLE